MEESDEKNSQLIIIHINPNDITCYTLTNDNKPQNTL